MDVTVDEQVVITGRDISVVIAAHNARSFIVETLESVHNQTERVGEIIVVDDASTDDTAEVVAALRDRMSLTLRVLDDNVGRAGARNAGCEMASGSWIACLDHDDIWLPTKIEFQAAFINSWSGRPLVVVGGQGRHINLAGEDLGILEADLQSETEFETLKRAGKFLFVPHSSALMKSEAFRQVGGYNSEYNAVDEIELWSRMAEIGTVINCDAQVFSFRKHMSSGSMGEFREQQVNTRFLIENLRRHAMGSSQIKKAQFLQSESDQPLRFKFRTKRKEVALYCYRRGAYSGVNNDRLEGAVYLICAALLDLRRVLSGIRQYRK